MRIVLDSNIYFSALLFPKSKMAALLETVSRKHTLIMSNTIIEDLTSALSKKVPEVIPALEGFFAKLTYEYQFVPLDYVKTHPAEIRDVKDKHVLATAYFAGADMIITGDEDFFEKTYEGLTIIRPAEFKG